MFDFWSCFLLDSIKTFLSYLQGLFFNESADPGSLLKGSN